MLLLLLLLLTKHLIVDFPLQTSYQYLNKGTFLHPGGILHAGLHGIATAAILQFFTPWAAILSVLEGVAHYFIDYTKMNVNKKYNLLPNNSEQFWWLLGLDQYLHQVCYLLIVWFVFK